MNSGVIDLNNMDLIDKIARINLKLAKRSKIHIYEVIVSIIVENY